MHAKVPHCPSFNRKQLGEFCKLLQPADGGAYFGDLADSGREKTSRHRSESAVSGSWYEECGTSPAVSIK